MSTLSGTYAASSKEWVRDQVEAYEASGGSAGNTFKDLPIVVMTSVGAKSGLLRKNPLMRIEHQGEYAVVASGGGSERNPTWYYNLLKNPVVELQDGPDKHRFVAREVHGEEREQWWERAVRAYPDFVSYTVGLARTIPVFVLERS